MFGIDGSAGRSKNFTGPQNLGWGLWIVSWKHLERPRNNCQAARLDYCTSAKAPQGKPLHRDLPISRVLSNQWFNLQEKERLQRQKDAAKKILPLLKDPFSLESVESRPNVGIC